MPKYSIEVSFDIVLDCASEESAQSIGDEKVYQVAGGWHDPFGADWDSFVKVEEIKQEED